MKTPTLKPMLEADNERFVTDSRKSLTDNPDVSALLVLLAQVFDYSAKGGDAYITFTTNRKKTELMVTLGVDGEKTYVTGPSLKALLPAFQHLL